MLRLPVVVLASLLLSACGGDDGDDAADSQAPTTDEPQDTGADTAETESGSETGETDPVCLPNGSYGPCSEYLCQCLQGADVYQTCTVPCTETSQCGDPADFPGATPDCAPVNPSDTAKVCMLRCATTADCPCGLECEPTVLICTEPQ